jgi:hypothetical protein
MQVSPYEVHDMKLRSGYIDPLFFYLVTRWRCVVSFKLCSHSLCGKVPIQTGPGRIPELVWTVSRGEKRRKFLYCRDSNHCYSVLERVTSSLHRLIYPSTFWSTHTEMFRCPHISHSYHEIPPQIWPWLITTAVVRWTLSLVYYLA